jgi:ketosteroid isomerase-like protein
MSESESESESLSPHMTRSQFESVIEALLDRRSKPQRLAPLFAPEAEWLVNGDQACWAFAGRRRSRASILAYLQAFYVEFERKAMRRLDTLIEGEQACVRFELLLQHRGTRREEWLQCLCFIRLEGELIVEVSEFFDSATLFRLQESRA